MTIDQNTETQIAVNVMVHMTVMLDRNKLPGYADSIRERWDDTDLVLEAFDMTDILIQAHIDGDIDLPGDWDVNDADYSDSLFSMEYLENLGKGK